MKEIAARLLQQREAIQGRYLCQKQTGEFADAAMGLMFAQWDDQCPHDITGYERTLENHRQRVERLVSCVDTAVRARDVAQNYLRAIPELQQTLVRDAQFICDNDPAARDVSEVMACYPGFLAISIYRLASFFWHQQVPLLPRFLTELAHSRTGIDIHPGAQIGTPFCIDHGTGIVVGETTVIGNRVKLFQGVTLGALSVSKGQAGAKRHPTIEDDCLIYSHATILGGETTVGRGSTIGGNVWLTKSVAAGSKVFYRLDSAATVSPAG